MAFAVAVIVVATATSVASIKDFGVSVAAVISTGVRVGTIGSGVKLGGMLVGYCVA
jgi:hypothetical protein